jgi:ammonium transporter, Amt family
MTSGLRLFTITALLSAIALAAPASAQTPDANADISYILNTFLFLFGGVLVMWMASGFAMLEVGFVRSKHASTICLKNIGLYAIAGIAFYLIGYRLMYDGVSDHSGLFGTPAIWGPSERYGDTVIDVTANGYASSSDWFFQMVFVATTASIISGAVAERVRIGAFFIFVAVMAALIYPVQGAWVWGKGWLYAMGFSDFAGSTLVHSVGGWAALIGIILLGARNGRFVDGKPVAMHGSSLPLATLGTLILWMGWFGFNGASQLAMGTVSDITAIAQIFANTNMAAAGGVLAAYLLSMAIGRGKANLGFALNGALAGLVSITADPLHPSIAQAILIGGVGAVIATFGVLLLERLRIDDVVGAIPVHLFAGIWGTIVVPLTNPDANVYIQVIGILAIGAFVSAASTIVWLGLKYTIGIRLSSHEEAVGGDLTELGQLAYPEFVSGPDASSGAGKCDRPKHSSTASISPAE